jgi:hypothetical protein
MKFDDQEMMAKAIDNQALTEGRPASLKRIVDEAELVFAVWPPKDPPDGAGYMIIKGERRLRAFASRVLPPPPGTVGLPSTPVTMTWDAILVASLEQAAACRAAFGEPESD